MQRLMIAAAALAAVTAPGLASAGEGENQRREEISVRGYDLAIAADVAALERRIGRAAERVCRVSGRRDLGARAAESACEARAEAKAMAQLKTMRFAELASRD